MSQTYLLLLVWIPQASTQENSATCPVASRVFARSWTMRESDVDSRRYNSNYSFQLFVHVRLVTSISGWQPAVAFKMKSLRYTFQCFFPRNTWKWGPFFVSVYILKMHHIVAAMMVISAQAHKAEFSLVKNLFTADEFSRGIIVASAGR